MKDGEEVTRFEVDREEKLTVMYMLIAMGVVGMVINLWFLSQGQNIVALVTFSGALILAGLSIRVTMPRFYEISDYGLTAIYLGRQKSIMWKEVDLRLSTSALKCHRGVTIPLFSVKDRQDEFSRQLLARLRTQIEYEADWRVNNKTYLKASITPYLVIICPMVFLLIFLSTTISSLGTRVLPQLIPLFPILLILPFTMYTTVLRSQRPVITQTYIRFISSIIYYQELNSVKIGVDGMKGIFYFNNLSDGAKCPLIESMIIVNILKRLSPKARFSAENRVLELLPPELVQSNSIVTTSPSP